MKRSIFDEQTSKALMNWHKKAKQHKPVIPKPGGMKTTTLGGGSPDDSPESSPMHPGSAGRSSSEMPNQNSASTGHMANIVASVDIPGDSPPAGDDGRSANTDLLTGP